MSNAWLGGSEKKIYVHMLIAYAKQIMATCVNIAGENWEMVL